MAVTVDQIRSEFPEFAKTTPVLIGAKLADAEGLLDVSAWGLQRDQAVKYMACHLLALSPGGEFARLDPAKEPDGSHSIYERHFKQLKKTVAGAMVV